ncbi:MAG: hypothetical protein FWG65_13180 [Turicibacter sp.]|nr:hypothetical protein [Turicibacter sp.]
MTKTIEIPANSAGGEGRTFEIKKMPARVSLKIAKTLLASAVPFFGTVAPSKIAEFVKSDKDIDKFLENLDLIAIANALDNIEDESLDKLINAGLANCYEILPAGSVQVLNPNGTYNVPGVEDDLLVMLRLTIESLVHSVRGFFQENRSGSVLGELRNLFPSQP